MVKKFIYAAGGCLGCLALLANTGCANCAKGCGKVTQVTSTKKPCGEPCKTAGSPCPKLDNDMMAELPRNAKAGECWAKVYVPPTFKTVTERVMVKQASEQIEIIPAKYDWVEERVCIKEASKRLVEVPAEYKTETITVRTDPAHTDWQITKVADCDIPGQAPKNAQLAGQDVFCLVNFPENRETLSVQKVAKAAHVEEEVIPAEYQTIRRQKVVQAATTRKVCIPAEYQTVEKSVKVCDGRMAWQRVECEKPHDAVTLNNNKGATKVQFVQNNRISVANHD